MKDIQKKTLSKRFVVVLILLIFMFSVFKIGVSFASADVLTLVGTKILSKSDYVEVNSIDYEKNRIINDIIFHQVGDSVTYQITVKNNEKKDYTIKSITDDNKNDYITYEYEDYSGTKIASKQEQDIKIIATYSNEVKDISERTQDFSANFKIILEDTAGNEKEEDITINPEDTDVKTEDGIEPKSKETNKIKGPKTGDNVEIYFVTAISSFILLILMSRKKKNVLVKSKNASKNKGKHFKLLGLLLITVIVLPTVSKAVASEVAVISLKNNIKLMDKIQVKFEVGEKTEETIVNYKEKIENVENPSKDGYEFNGWKLENGTAFDYDTEITEDLKLVADFEAIPYTISYELNGGDVEENPENYTIESEDIILNKPSKEGYKFIGWTGTDLKGTVENVVINEGSTGNRRYIANYAPIEYSIMYHLDGGRVTGNPTEYTIETEDIELNKPSKEGYSFIGWTGTDLDEETEDVIIYKDSMGNREYTANYEPIEYTISYNGLTDEEESELNNPTEYNIESDSITLNNPNNRTDDDGDLTQIFVGWKDEETTSINTVIETGTIGNKEYTAVWENVDPDVYTITYNLNGGSVDASNPTSYTKHDATFTLNNPEKAGYEFDGWTGSNGDIPEDSVQVENGTRGNLNFVANYTPIEYTILYNLKGGTATNDEIYTVESESITLNNPSKTGYTFKGWTGTDLEEKTMEVIIPQGSIGDREYTASYEANTYEIVFNANTGRGSMANQLLKYDEEKQLNENQFIKPGYTFIGWNTESNGNGDSYEDKDTVENLAEDGRINLYAQWQANTNTSYTVIHKTMNINGVGYTEKERETLYGTTDTSVTPAVKTYIGFTSPTEEELVINGDGTSEITYLYTRNKYSFSVTDRSLVEDTTTPDDDYYYETEITIKAKEKTGYTLSKWSNNLSASIESFELTEDTEIYPIYKPNQYTVVFDANGGTGSMTNQELTYDQEKKLLKNTYTKLGMRFVSWNTKSDGTGVAYNDEEQVKNLVTQGTFKLYAVYEDVAYAQFRSDMKGTMTTLSGGVTNITAIKYSSTIPTSATTQNVGVTGNDLVPIYMWYDSGTIYWNSDDITPLLTGSWRQLFMSFTNLENIDGLANWDTTGLTSLNETFTNCTKLTSVEALKTWDVSAVTDLGGTFRNTGLTSLEGLEDWQTGNVQTLKSTFTSCSSLANIEALRKWNVSSVKSMSGLLQNCTSVTSISALANWNTKEVTETIQTFQGCTGLTSLTGLENWNMSKNKNMRDMFYQAKNIQSLKPLAGWDTSQVENINRTFAQLKVITNLEGLEGWNTSNVTNFSSTFDDSNLVTTLSALSSWDVSSGTNFNGMFYSLRNLTTEGSQSINGWELSKTATFNNMFRNVNNKPTFMFDVGGTMTQGTWDSNGTLIVPQ